MTFPTIEHFLCDYQELLSRIDAIDPRSYDVSRNYLDGSVTWLSPFVTHGIIDTALIAKRLLARHSAKQCNRLLFELAWREYFHRVWQQHQDAIFSDMRAAPDDAGNALLNTFPPSVILNGQIGINAIDECVHHLLEHGVMHNHARMWTASLACNIGKTHWLEPARWMHYHLLDGDLASNSLSWQWVAGTFSNKRYIANQDNVNKYAKRTQQSTFIDCTYEELATLTAPDSFHQRSEIQYELNIPGKALAIDADTVALRSLWNLDPNWQAKVDHHIVFVNEQHYRQWPMSKNRWRFIKHWVDSIPGSEVMFGTVEELNACVAGKSVACRKHTACADWSVEQEPRNWLYRKPAKTFNSFFAFWNQVKDGVGL